MSCTGRSSRALLGRLGLFLLPLLLNPTSRCDAQCVGGVSHRLKMSALLDSIYPPWSAGCLSRAPAGGKRDEPIDERLPVDWDSLVISANESQVPTTQHQPNLTDIADYLLDVTVQHELADSGPVHDELMSATEAGYITSLNRKMFSINVPFNPAHSARVSDECKRQSALFFRSYAASELWALRMHDASAKVGQGILNGNINQYGDFDQCLNIQQKLLHDGDGLPADGGTMRGRYCMAEVQPTIKPNTQVLKHLFDLIQAHGMLKSNLNDPGHRVPRFSTVH